MVVESGLIRHGGLELEGVKTDRAGAAQSTSMYRLQASVYREVNQGGGDPMTELETIVEGKRNHYAALDGLRGWAAASVVLYHSILPFDDSLHADVMLRQPWNLSGFRQWSSWLVLNGANGEFAVQIFFVLSGLVLADSIRKSSQAFNLASVASFVVRRIARLMPTLSVAIVIAWITVKVLKPAFLASLPPITLIDVWKI